MASGWVRRVRQALRSTGREARPASPPPAPPERVVGWDGDLPERDRDLTVVLVSRSDRYDALPPLLRTVREAFGVDVDVRVVGYVADASPVGEQLRGLPWVRDAPVDGIGSALNVGVRGGVGRVLVVVVATVSSTPEALVALAAAGRTAVATAEVTLPDGSVRRGARLLRPGALPWSDDGSADSVLRSGDAAEETDARGLDVVARSGDAAGDGDDGGDGAGGVRRPVADRVFAADQPVLSMPGAVVGPAPCLQDERTTLAVWSRAAADRTGGPVRVVGTVRRSDEAGRTIDAAVVDAVTAWRDRAPDGDGVVSAGPPLPPWGARPVAPATRVSAGGALSWSLKTAAPAGAEGDGWGDVHFATELGDALERLGQRVRIDRRDAHVRDDDATDDVTLVVRGLDRVPPNPASVNLLWVISHPDDVSDTELRSFDAVFAAGPAWAARATASSGVAVRTLLQATDPAVFHPVSAELAGSDAADGGSAPDGTGAPAGDSRSDAGRVVFVGSTRGTERPIVTEAVALGADLVVHGPGWADVVPAEVLGAPSLDRRAVATAYGTARVVLNDHWPDMAAGGFVSNRVFDVLAAGGVVVTDPVVGLAEVLDVPTLRVAASRAELATLLDPAAPWPDAAERAEVAARIATEHSFDARAAVLLDVARAERARLRR